MAKINSVDTIQSKSNKVTTPLTSSSAANWTNDQYPPASRLYELQSTITNRINNLHPVGSTVCMSTNINPSIYYGGTWVLIDKSFRYTALSITADNWIPSYSTLDTGTYFNNQNKIYLYDKIMTISISLTPSGAMTGDNTYTLGKLNFVSLGLHPCTFFGIVSGSMQGDGSQARICYTWTDGGTLTCYDALYAGADGTHRADADTLVFTTRHTLTPNQMPDNLCNKFVFKRTS